MNLSLPLFGGVLIQKFLNTQIIYENLLLAILEDVTDPLIL